MTGLLRSPLKHDNAEVTELSHFDAFATSLQVLVHAAFLLCIVLLVYAKVLQCTWVKLSRSHMHEYPCINTVQQWRSSSNACRQAPVCLHYRTFIHNKFNFSHLFYCMGCFVQLSLMYCAAQAALTGTWACRLGRCAGLLLSSTGCKQHWLQVCSLPL